MDRSQREAELRELLTTQRGKEELLQTLKKHAGIDSGNLPTFGTLLVQTILNYEFPGDAEPADRTIAESEEGSRLQPDTTGETRMMTSPVATHSATPDKEAPGDTKFEQPPGQESPGG